MVVINLGVPIATPAPLPSPQGQVEASLRRFRVAGFGQAMREEAGEG